MVTTTERSLCADPVRDAAIRPIVAQSVELVVDAVGVAALEGIVLTGSLARSEASVMLGPTGPRMLGDIEFLVIVRASRPWALVRRQMARLGRMATRAFGGDGDVTTVEYTPATVRYLTHAIRPSIFAHDLRTHGRVLWGRPDLLRLIAPFGVEAIPPEDAVELVMNRMIEQLALELDAGRGGVDPLVSGYQVVKTVLDLAGSALAFSGRHTSCYAERPRAFQFLLAERPDLRDAMPAVATFEELLALATSTKLAPSAAAVSGLGTRRLAGTVADWAGALWVWEARQLLRRPAATVDELIDAYLRAEAPATRLRGWAKFYSHPLRPATGRLPSLGPGWLPASPRRRLYAAALLASVGRARRIDDWAARAARLLPGIRPTTEPVPARIVDLWRWLVRNN